MWNVQFIFDLPQRLRKCMSSENYAAAVKCYQGALPILKVILLLLCKLKRYPGCDVPSRC